MASKFQNRLVGTIIIVALGVIVLPGLLDGKKKHYEDNFAAIPLVPKPGDTDEGDAYPQANQSLPSQPPEGAGAAVVQSNKAQSGDDSAAAGGNNSTPATPPKAPARRESIKTAPSKPVEQDKPAVKPPVVKADTKQEPKPATTQKPVTPAKETVETPPQGQAWVVQLGALKNAAKVREIVAKLRLAGYRAYTVPSVPVAGQITRIFVGPEASKQKLEAALPEMNRLSELSGQLRAYQAH
ncbi:cell division protein DedD [Acerihabitans sp. TG2]|uniref:cell division protein DedD n=1 Tax=Acerihabitans sp. TG2 TaxID=3096008 RepID=UPI002B2377FF|nr:cell division protein DedD [Acerihabitans sp. TG2]MEA9389128.1 cell division protein DedD [Acerihabitans sp. TG2]